jgi:secondary thiamine-phosphate synthase enzyme
MKIIQKDFRLSTRSRCQMLDITDELSSIVHQSGISDGDAIVYCPHTTAAVTINENADTSVCHDILLILEKLVPRSNPDYHHSEGNSDAHCKSVLVGCSKQILIKGGALELGTWQGIFFCEFDGPRSRRVIVQVRGQ